MKFIKHALGQLPSCYSVAGIESANGLQLLFASEQIDGACFAYAADDYTARTTVWESAGGAMSIVPIPHTQGEFLAVQNFFPGFAGETAKLVRGKLENGHWVTWDIVSIPYLHRFDVFYCNGKNYVLACTLCGQREKEDIVTNPGSVYAFQLPEAGKEAGVTLLPIVSGLIHNHGYWRGTHRGEDAGYIACDNGVYALLPPQDGENSWTIHVLMDKPVSDIAAFDIDGDEMEELICIEPFHGNIFKLYKWINGGYREQYQIENEKEMEFSHVVWMGLLRGKPAILCGYRRQDAELFVLFPSDMQNDTLKAQIIEQGHGPSNISVIPGKQKDLLLVANNSTHEAALFEIWD